MGHNDPNDTSDVNDIKVLIGRIDERLKIVERFVYAVVGVIGLGVLGALLSLAFESGSVNAGAAASVALLL
jgi:hypothetical protein